MVLWPNYWKDPLSKAFAKFYNINLRGFSSGIKAIPFKVGEIYKYESTGDFYVGFTSRWDWILSYMNNGTFPHEITSGGSILEGEG